MSNTLLTLTVAVVTVAMVIMISMLMTMVVIMAVATGVKTMIISMVAMTVVMSVMVTMIMSGVSRYRWGGAVCARLCICLPFALLWDLSALWKNQDRRSGNRANKRFQCVSLSLIKCATNILSEDLCLFKQTCILAVICLYLMCAVPTYAFAVGIFDRTLNMALSDDGVWK